MSLDDRPSADRIAHMGLVAFHRGDTREAILLADRALSLARTNGNRRHEGVALVYLAYFEFWRGRFARVERLIDAAEDTYAELGDPGQAFELPIVLGIRATLHAMRGLPDEADAQYEAALQAARDRGVEWFEGIVLGQRAHFMSATNPRRSRTDARRSYELLVEMGDEWWQVWALRAQGIVETVLGNHAAAESVLHTALERSPGLQERALTLIALGTNSLELGQPDRAGVLLRESLDAAREVDVGFVVAWAASLLGRAEPERADHWLRIVHEHDDGDAAYEQLLATDLRITVLGDAGVWRGANRLAFATRHAEMAVYSLALADGHTIHAEVLAERLWPDAPADRVGGRLGTLVWQVRRGLGADSWRLRRQNDLLRLDCRGLDIDADTLRRAASDLLTATDVKTPAARATVAALSRPVLPALQYEGWVQQTASQLTALADRLAAILAN